MSQHLKAGQKVLIIQSVNQHYVGKTGIIAAILTDNSQKKYKVVTMYEVKFDDPSLGAHDFYPYNLVPYTKIAGLLYVDEV